MGVRELKFVSEPFWAVVLRLLVVVVDVLVLVDPDSGTETGYCEGGR